MNHRTCIGFIAALLVLSISASVEAAPRMGGGVRAGGFHGGHRFAVRPVAPVHRFHRVNKFAGHHRLGPHPGFGLRHRFARHHGRGHGKVDGAVVGGGILGSSYDGGYGIPPYNPYDPYAPLADPPLAVTGEAESPGATASVACRTSEQTVPRERGGVTQVRVTRCYPPEPEARDPAPGFASGIITR